MPQNRSASLLANPYVQTALALIAGGFGAVIGGLISLPLYPLMGPALFVATLALFGLPMHIADMVRDGAFLVIGIGIGAGIDPSAQAAFLRWPVAFVVLAALLVAIILVCRTFLVSGFGFDRRGAVLAASPGHLSYVLSLGAQIEADVTRITVVQSLRVLAMTVVLPFVLVFMGVDASGAVRLAEAVMSWPHLAGLVLAGLAASVVFKWMSVPAPLLIGGLVVSAAAHLTEIAPGGLHPSLSLAGYVVIGTLIGSRFTGLTVAQIRSVAFAGAATTVVSVVLAVGAAVPVAAFLDIPLAHVVIAFAPGGLDTMLAMGALLNADPGFVAACHVGRLLMLTVIVPLLVGRTGLKADP